MSEVQTGSVRRRRGFLVPPAIPDDVDDPRVEKARGKVRLPHHVQWTTPGHVYDLQDRRDCLVVYEVVLQQGLEEDVRYFIEVDKLVDLWDELYLPVHVRAAWADWLASRRGVRP
ncbi:MAG: hypothetical protein ACRDZ4_04415 [Egibacteraceae bacterium]